MNSREKSPILNKTWTLNTKEDLAKLHCVLNLFRQATGDDPYLAQNIKEAIDASLEEDQEAESSIDQFAEAAMRLLSQQPGIRSSYGLFHLDLSGRPFDLLFLREELLRGLRKVAGYRNALIVITGLRSAITHPTGYYTRERQERYQEAVYFIDELAAKWTTDSTEISILYV